MRSLGLVGWEIRAESYRGMASGSCPWSRWQALVNMLSYFRLKIEVTRLTYSSHDPTLAHVSLSKRGAIDGISFISWSWKIIPSRVKVLIKFHLPHAQWPRLQPEGFRLPENQTLYQQQERQEKEREIKHEEGRNWKDVERPPRGRKISLFVFFIISQSDFVFFRREELNTSENSL